MAVLEATPGFGLPLVSYDCDWDCGGMGAPGVRIGAIALLGLRAVLRPGGSRVRVSLLRPRAAADPRGDRHGPVRGRPPRGDRTPAEARAPAEAPLSAA